MLMQFTDISTDDSRTLLSTAKQSIEYGLQHKAAMPVNLNDYSELLQSQAACFVTLNLNQQLRGCIGTLEAYRALITDVSEHAFDAAFRDPRFSPLTAQELPLLEIHISILTPSEVMNISSEQDLIDQLQPGIDGLIIDDGIHRATFLPSVWEQLPEAKDFLNHLKRKAGMDANHWSDSIKASRYTTISIK